MLNTGINDKSEDTYANYKEGLSGNDIEINVGLPKDAQQIGKCWKSIYGDDKKLYTLGPVGDEQNPGKSASKDFSRDCGHMGVVTDDNSIKSFKEIDKEVSENLKNPESLKTFLSAHCFGKVVDEDTKKNLVSAALQSFHQGGLLSFPSAFFTLQGAASLTTNAPNWIGEVHVSIAANMKSSLVFEPKNDGVRLCASSKCFEMKIGFLREGETPSEALKSLTEAKNSSYEIKGEGNNATFKRKDGKPLVEIYSTTSLSGDKANYKVGIDSLNGKIDPGLDKALGYAFSKTCCFPIKEIKEQKSLLRKVLDIIVWPFKKFLDVIRSAKKSQDEGQSEIKQRSQPNNEPKEIKEVAFEAKYPEQSKNEKSQKMPGPFEKKEMDKRNIHNQPTHNPN